MARSWEEMLSNPIEDEVLRQSEIVSTAYGLITKEELDKIEREVNF
jgi:hypothetical protein